MADVDEDVPAPQQSLVLWALGLNRPELLYIVLGALGSIGDGAIAFHSQEMALYCVVNI